MKNINFASLQESYKNFRARAYKELNEQSRKDFFDFLETNFVEILINNQIIEKKI